MKRVALMLMLVLPLAAQSKQTPLTPEEQWTYAIAVLRDLAEQNHSLNNFRYHQAGFEDIDRANAAHAERLRLQHDLIVKHSACEQGDWNIEKKEWACPAEPASPAAQ